MKKIIIVGLIVLVLSILSGCLSNNNDEIKDMSSFNYEIHIRTSNSDKYTIIAPVAFNNLLNSSDMKSTIYESMNVVEGNAQYNFINTKYGFGLEINGSNDLIIKSKYFGEEYYGLFLSLDENETNFDYGDRNHWIFLNTSDSNDIRIKIFVTNEAKNKGGGCSEGTKPDFQKVDIDWNLIKTYRDLWKY